MFEMESSGSVSYSRRSYGDVHCLVSAGDVEESSDPLESFRCGVKEGIAAMILIREEHEIKTEEEAVRASNKTK